MAVATELLYRNYDSSDATFLTAYSNELFPTIEYLGWTAQTGYIFKEWNTSRDGTGTPFDPGESFPSPASYTTFYAIWEKCDVAITYKGSSIATMSASGTKTLETEGKYCEDDILITYTKLSGSATTPATTITANPTISVSSGGLITASVSGSQSVTPTVSAGYVSSGTAGTVSVSGSNTSQLTTQAAQTIHPSTTDQTITSGKYLTGAQTVKGVLLTNLSAENIKKDVVVKVGDSTDDDCVTSVTGTYEGGTGPAYEQQINFVDYDGTLLHSYTKAEINAMTSESDLPANPSHGGLTAQGWNWTLAQIKAQLTAAPDGDVWVGQMYVTTSGATEIDVSLSDGRLDPVLAIAVDGSVSVDWGDESTPDLITGSDLYTRIPTSHSYASSGNYTISISVTSGEFTFYNSNVNYIFNSPLIYTARIKAVRIGTGITKLNNYAFYYCHSLKSITIPNSIISVGQYAFGNCYNLTHITIPSNVTSIAAYAYYKCYSLLNIALPSGVTNTVGNYAFSYCTSLYGITIPAGVTNINTYSFSYCYALQKIVFPGSSGSTSIGTYAFYYCYSLETVVLPNTITTIGQNAFYYCYSINSINIPTSTTSIAQNAFYYCTSLSIITIPNNVTNIGMSAFNSCNGVKEYHIRPTSVPTGGSSMFGSNASDVVIYVPQASLNDYQTASNWSSYASKMIGE